MSLAGAGRIALLTLAWLFAFDLAIGFVTRLPEDPRIPPSRWQEYFNYGRSIEAKLRYMMRDSRELSAPITHAGWLDSNDAAGEPTRASKPGAVLVAGYGQSFTAHILQELNAIDPSFELRLLGGPAAPLSHSYALYRADQRRHQGDVVVIGVLASTLPRLTSMTNMTTMFEAPAPATFPRYMLEDGKLTAIEPSVRSYEDLRQAIEHDEAWSKLIDQLQRHDAAYADWIFRKDLLDVSTMGLVARRGLGQRHVREHNAKYHGPHGFTNRDRLIDVAEALLADFAERVRADGRIPYVLLINDGGYADHLYQALGPALERRGIGYFSTHEVAPSTRSDLFIKDGHFRPEVNRQLAAALHEALTSEIGRRLTGDAKVHR